jgi:hypothetical protein
MLKCYATRTYGRVGVKLPRIQMAMSGQLHTLAGPSTHLVWRCEAPDACLGVVMFMVTKQQT